MNLRRGVGCLWVGVLIVLALGAGVSGGILLDRLVLQSFSPPGGISAEAAPSFELIAQAWNAVQRSYVDRSAIEAKRLTYGAITGMVEALGDTGHSRFLSPEMVAAESHFAKGEYEGIGAEVQSKDGQVVIVSPMDDSPAQKAGLRTGDVILKVNGADVAGLSLGSVVSQVLGPAGTTVSLTVLSGDVTREVAVVRARIPLQNVTWARIPGTDVADLRLAAFSDGVGQDLGRALREIQAQQLKGVILDLRNNPGGLLDEAVGVTSQFLSTGNVLQVKDAQGEIKAIAVQPGGAAPTLPLVVLINNGTASASEITSGALQDAGRAQLVGEKTFGTGTVLNTFNLNDGSALLLATQEWLTPAGRVIWHQGIAPDIQVTLDASVAPLRPRDIKEMTAQQVLESKDAQLLRALQLLNP